MSSNGRTLVSKTRYPGSSPGTPASMAGRQNHDRESDSLSPRKYISMKPFPEMNTANSALLVIDVINSSANEKCEIPEWGIHFSKIRMMVPRLARFIEEYRNKIGGLIVFTKNVPWTKEYLAENINNLYSDSRFAYYSKDTTGFPEQFYGIEPKENDLVIVKNTNDAIANPALEEDLQKRGIKYIVIAGAFTDGCVLATVAGGFSKGYNFVVLRDLVETTDVPIRQNIQKELLDHTFPYLFARVVNANELLESW